MNQKKENCYIQFRLKIDNGQSENKQKTVKDIIDFVSKKWNLQHNQVELRLCKSTADIVQQDTKNLMKFDWGSKQKISELLKIDQDPGEKINSLEK